MRESANYADHHNVRISVDITVLSTERQRRSNVGVEKKSKYFVTYLLPNGEMVKSDDFYMNKSAWASHHDMIIDLGFIRKFNTDGLDFCLYRSGKNIVNADREASESEDDKLDASQLDAKKKFYDSFKGKSSRTRHHPQILRMKTHPQPHHHDLPDKTLIHNVGADSFSIQSTTDESWNIFLFSNAVQKTKAEPTSQDLISSIPYERSKTPPLPHHSETPEKHHELVDVGSSNVDKPVSHGPFLPLPHHSSTPEKITGIKRQTYVEAQEFIAKFSIDPQYFLQGGRKQNITSLRPHEDLETVIINLEFDDYLLNEAQKKILNVTTLSISSFDKTLLDKLYDIENITLKFKFVDGSEFCFKPIGFKEDSVVFSDKKILLIADYDVNHLLQNKVEIRICSVTDKVCSVIAVAKISLAELLSQDETNFKFNSNLTICDKRPNAASLKPYIKFKLDLKKRYELNVHEAQKLSHKHSRTNHSLSTFLSRYLSKNGTINRMVIFAENISKMKKVLFLVQEYNMKLLDFNIYNQCDLKKFESYNLSPEERSRNDLISGLLINIRSESFIFLEGNSLNIMAKDDRFLDIKRFAVDDFLPERQFAQLQPKLIRIDFEQSLGELLSKGSFYMTKNEYLLSALKVLNDVKSQSFLPENTFITKFQAERLQCMN